MADKGARISSDELRKAAAETEGELRALLKKSQGKFDFGDPHHVGYTRTNARGTVSTIAAKNPRAVQVATANAKHTHTGQNVHIKETARLSDGSKVYALKTEGGHVIATSSHPEGLRLHAKDKMLTIATDVTDPEEQTPDRHALQRNIETLAAEKGMDPIALISQLQTGAAASGREKLVGLLGAIKNRYIAKQQKETQVPSVESPAPAATPAAPAHTGKGPKHDEIHDRLTALNGWSKKDLVAKVKQTHRIVDTNGMDKTSARNMILASQFSDKHLQAYDEYNQQPKAKSPSPKAAAKELKTILESADFGYTAAGGNGRVKANADGTLTVYDSFYYGQDEAMTRHKAAWSPGGHNADYFAGEGFDVKILGTDSELRSKVFGKKENAGHVAVTLAVTKKAPVAKSLREEITSATMLLKSHVKAYQRTTASGASVTVKEHDDSRQKHPNIIGTATKMDHKDASKANTFTHAGKLYSSTGKEGRSMHDDRPVREFEEVREGAGHRTWLDHSGNVHADSKEEADRHHKRGMYAEQTKEKKKKAPTAKGDAPPHGDANSKHWANLPDDENPKYAISGASSRDLAKVAQGKDDLNRRAKVELANRGLDSDAKWVGFDKADEHHKVTKEEKARRKSEDDIENGIGGEIQTVHNNILSAAAKGHLDLNKRAKHELANRGHDSNGKWIGFDAAEKHHGVK
jgi:hypothetical protein